MTTRTTSFCVTSPSPDQADAARLLELTRSHWTVENGCFRTRDVTFGEEASRVRTGTAPQIFTAIRNPVMTLLWHPQISSLAATVRECGWNHNTAFARLGLSEFSSALSAPRGSLKSLWACRYDTLIDEVDPCDGMLS